MVKKTVVALLVTMMLACAPAVNANASTITEGQSQTNLTQEQQNAILDFVNSKEITQNNLTVYENDVTDYYGVDGNANAYWY